MKPNVDLTENRIFNHIANNVIFEPMNININDKDIIFEEILQELNNINSNTTEIIVTGNADERLNARMLQDFGNNNNHCDRCGETIPWKFMNNSGLCDECQEDLMSSDDMLTFVEKDMSAKSNLYAFALQNFINKISI